MSKEIEEKLVIESATTMTELIMPNETNPLGNLMGGYLMKWMDIAGGICAAKHAEAHVVTASVDHVSFQSPIHLGDVIMLNARVTKAFTTSVEIYVEVTASDITGKNARKSNHAYLTFVALDADQRKPIAIPKVRPVSTEEQKLFDGASRRRELRLILSGRINASEAKDLKSYFNEMK